LSRKLKRTQKRGSHLGKRSGGCLGAGQRGGTSVLKNRQEGGGGDLLGPGKCRIEVGVTLSGESVTSYELTSILPLKQLGGGTRERGEYQKKEEGDWGETQKKERRKEERSFTGKGGVQKTKPGYRV